MNSSASLNTTIDFIYTFVIPSICFCGILANALNLFILNDPSLKNVIYKYLVINAISNLFYYTICFFIFLPRCGSFCTISHSYPPQFYLYLFYNYLKNIASYASILIELLVSLQRLAFVLNIQNFNINKSCFISMVLIAISSILNLPLLLSKSLKFTSHYLVVLNEFGQSELGKSLVIVISVTRGFVLISAILVANVVTVIKLKQRMDIKRSMRFAGQSRLEQNENKASRNLTLMVVVMGFLNFCAYLPNSAAYIMQEMFEPNNKFYRIYLVSSNLIFLLVKTSDVFVFYFFNKSLKKVFKKMLSKYFCSC